MAKKTPKKTPTKKPASKKSLPPVVITGGLEWVDKNFDKGADAGKLVLGLVGPKGQKIEVFISFDSSEHAEDASDEIMQAMQEIHEFIVADESPPDEK